MKLSEVLNRYYVVALHQSELVGFYEDDLDGDVDIVIEWNDSDEFETHRQVFKDQEIRLLVQPTGGFIVTNSEGMECGFIALAGVPKEQLEP